MNNPLLRLCLNTFWRKYKRLEHKVFWDKCDERFYATENIFIHEGERLYLHIKGWYSQNASSVLSWIKKGIWRLDRFSTYKENLLKYG